MYHYVRPDSSDFPYFKSLHIEDFKNQLNYFDKTFGFVGRSEFNNYILGETEKLPQGVVLTFDDGLMDHYEFVFPELERRNLWGIFYIPTGPQLNKKLLNVHRTHCLLGQYGGETMLEAALSSVNNEMLEAKHVKEFKELTYARQDNDQATLRFKRLFNYFLRPKFRNSILDKLVDQFIDERSITQNYYVNAQQLKEMQDRGMIIGGHTVNHPVLSTLNRKEQLSEIKGCLDWLNFAVGESEIQTFCFPYGGGHCFNEDTIGILTDLNCRFCLSVEQRDVNKHDLAERPLALPRFDCNQFKHGQVRG